MAKYSLHEQGDTPAPLNVYANNVSSTDQVDVGEIQHNIIQGKEGITTDLPRGIKRVNKDGTAELNTDFLSSCNIFIGTPCYGGNLTDQYFLSMMRLMQVFGQFKINSSINTLRNESLIPRARNNLTAMFLHEKSFTHLLFVDADIEFDPEAVVRLLALDRDIIAGAYPKKTINWEQIKRAIDAGKTDNLSVYGAEYAINFKLNENNQVRTFAGAIEVLDASTGFMLVKREVFEKMIEAYPETKYKNDSAIPEYLHDHCYALWDTMIDPDSRRYLSEDYTFCRRHQMLGGEIWIDPYTKLNHIGTYSFEGDLKTILQIPGN